MEDIIGISKQMTREEFIKDADKLGHCPILYGLEQFNKECSFENLETCHKCFNEALKDIKFNDEQEG